MIGAVRRYRTYLDYSKGVRQCCGTGTGTVGTVTF
jgi:hypothetical protein